MLGKHWPLSAFKRLYSHNVVHLKLTYKSTTLQRKKKIYLQTKLANYVPQIYVLNKSSVILKNIGLIPVFIQHHSWKK